MSFKIRISQKVFVHPNRSKNPLFKTNNFRFEIIEAPGTNLIYHQMSKKDATERAFQAAPGCTFKVHEF